MDLREIIGLEEIEEQTTKNVSEEEIAKAEAEMAQIDSELDKTIATEEYALETATMMVRQIEIVSQEGVSEDALKVLETSLESIANYGKIDKEVLVPSVEEAQDKKDGMVAKMKKFIQNVIVTFQTIYAKIMKYIVKWINKARILLGRKVNDEDFKAIEDAAKAGKVKKVDEKTKVDLAILEALGKTPDLKSKVPEAKVVAALKGMIEKDLYENEEDYKAAKKAKTLAEMGFELKSATAVSATKVAVGVRFVKGINDKYNKLFGGLVNEVKDLSDFVFGSNDTHTIVTVSLNEKELNEITSSTVNEITFRSVDTKALKDKTDAKRVNAILDANFKDLEALEGNFKNQMEKVKKKEDVTTEEVLKVKQEFLIASKKIRTNMFVVVSKYKEAVTVTKTLAKWAKEESKKEEK